MTDEPRAAYYQRRLTSVTTRMAVVKFGLSPTFGASLISNTPHPERIVVDSNFVYCAR